MATKREIAIWSGEGDGPGKAEVYTGKRTERALRMRLTRECCGGDRWARATWADTGEPISPDATEIEEG
jgi:hypothetical protein